MCHRFLPLADLCFEASRQCKLDLEEIDKFCELVKQNLGGLTYENKRIALEALGIKVWIDGSDVSIEGAIPVQDVSVVSTPSLYSGYNKEGAISVPFSCAAQL